VDNKVHEYICEFRNALFLFNGKILDVVLYKHMWFEIHKYS